MAFVRKDGYYTGTVYEWNLPTGWTCPGARECLVRVDRETGKQDNRSNGYRCYAAAAERFPGVRQSRWGNLEIARSGLLPPLPRAARAVRIHSSGDFFSQGYFDTWLEYAAANEGVAFWSYTKSLPFWIARLGSVPHNLTLTASVGGKWDHLIGEHGLRSATVVNLADLPPGGAVDTNDDLARTSGESFFLLNNQERPGSATTRQI